MKRFPLLLCLLALFFAPACAAKLIPGTMIEDTDEARQILDVMRAYTEALEARDIEKIVALASVDFFENAGTVEGDDDFDRQGIESKLKAWFSHFKSVRSRIEVRKITFEENPEGEIVKAAVIYFYDISFQVPEGNGSDKLVWRTESDTKEMVLQLEEGMWKILHGI